MINAIIRKANPEDLRSIVDLEELISLEKYPNEKFGITEDDIGRIGFGLYRVKKYQSRFFDNSSCEVWLAESNERIVGFTAATKSTDLNHLSKLYILPHNPGVGTSLLQVALKWLGPDNDVVLGAAEYDTEAISFYKRNGFIVVGIWPEDTTVLPTGKILRQTKLLKKASNQA